jgi:hypothetical protein
MKTKDGIEEFGVEDWRKLISNPRISFSDAVNADTLL